MNTKVTPSAVSDTTEGKNNNHNNDSISLPAGFVKNYFLIFDDTNPNLLAEMAEICNGNQENIFLMSDNIDDFSVKVKLKQNIQNYNNILNNLLDKKINKVRKQIQQTKKLQQTKQIIKEQQEQEIPPNAMWTLEI